MTKLTIAVKTQSAVRWVKRHVLSGSSRATPSLSSASRAHPVGADEQPGRRSPGSGDSAGTYSHPDNRDRYQTYGETFDVTDAEKTIDIKLNPPQQQ